MYQASFKNECPFDGRRHQFAILQKKNQSKFHVVAPPAGVAVENLWYETDERPFERLVFCQVQGRRDQRFLEAGRRQESDREIPGFPSLIVGGDPLLEKLLGDMGHRVVSFTAITCTWAYSCVVAESVEDLATHGALGISGENRDVEAVLWSCSDKVGIPRDLETSVSQRLQGFCAVRSQEGRWRVEDGVPDVQDLFLIDAWSRSRVSGVGLLEDASHEGSLHLRSAEEEAVGRRRASMAADLSAVRQKRKKTRAVAGDWRRSSWAISFSARSAFREGRSPGTEGGSKQREAYVRRTVFRRRHGMG